MNNCILIKINNETFKFEGVELLGKEGKSPSITYRNILYAIHNNPLHIDLLNKLVETINNTEIDINNRSKLIIESSTTFADNTVGEIVPRNLVTMYTNLGYTDQEIIKLVNIIPNSGNASIKISPVTTKKPQIYLGEKLNLIVSDTSSLSPSKMQNAFAYLYLDHKSKDSSSDVFHTLLNLYTILKEEARGSNDEVLNKLLASLTGLDSATVNKRLLLAVFSTIFNEATLPLIATFRTNLTTIIKLKLESITNTYSSSYLDPTILISLLTSLKFEESQYGGIDQSTFLSIHRSLLKAYETPLGLKSIKPDPIEEEERELLVTLFKEFNPDGTYSTSNMKNISTKEYEVLKIKEYLPMFSTIYNMDNNVKNVDLKKICDDMTENLRKLLGIETKETIQSLEDGATKTKKSESADLILDLTAVDIYLDNDLTATPTRQIRFNFNKKITPDRDALTVKIAPLLKARFRIVNNTLFFNPASNIIPKDLDKNKILTLYIPSVAKSEKSNTVQYYNLIIELLSTLRENTRFQFINILGSSADSVRLAHEVMTYGLSPKIFIPTTFESEEEESRTSLAFLERFRILDNIPENIFNPSFKFYNYNSSNGYLFSSRIEGEQNLNDKLTKLEGSEIVKENLVEDANLNLEVVRKPVVYNFNKLNLFKLLKENKDINSIIVSSDQYILASKPVNSTINLYDKDDSKNHALFTVTKTYSLNGRVNTSENISPKKDIGTIWDTKIKDKTIKVIILGSKGENIILKSLESGYATLELSENDLTKYIGIAEKNNNFCNYNNKVLFDIKTLTAIKISNKELLAEFYSEKLEEISEATGFSLLFLTNKIYNKPDKYSNELIMLLTPMLSIEEVKINTIPNFTGEKFVLRLAEKLNTKVHMLSGVQLAQLGLSTNAGLVYNGEIYINKDNLDKQSTVFHELTHIIIAYMKENFNDEYVKLVNSQDTNTDKFKEISSAYPNLTMSDRIEEYLAETIGESMYSKFVDTDLDTKLESAKIDEAINQLFELDEYVSFRILMTLTLEQVAKTNKEIAKEFGPIFKKSYPLTRDRISSIKSTLLASTDINNKLIEECK